jgi:hypothetical protein
MEECKVYSQQSVKNTYNCSIQLLATKTESDFSPQHKKRIA